MSQEPVGGKAFHLEVLQRQIYVRVFGSLETTSNPPLLIVHGGPGLPHNYLLPLGLLARMDRAVIFYDQAGGGLSEGFGDRSGISIQYFVDELEMVRDILDLKEVAILGHSWGGWLVIEYLCQGAHGIKSCVLASTSASVQDHLRSLPARFSRRRSGSRLATLRRRLFAQPSYDEFLRTHVCRLDPKPTILLEAEAKASTQVYTTLWGPDELTCTGPLRTWDRSRDLSALSGRYLVTSGRYDEVSVHAAHRLALALGANHVFFAASSHNPHLEQPDDYMAVVDRFLQECRAGVTQVAPRLSKRGAESSKTYLDRTSSAQWLKGRAW